MKKYKLTNEKLQTHNGFQWVIGREVVIEKPGNQLCTDQVLHFYDHPTLAVIFNPIHADISEPRLFECNVKDIVAHDKLKGGCKKMTLVKEIDLPAITSEQKVLFAIECAKQARQPKGWREWAEGWISRKDRSALAAAEAAALAAARAAARARMLGEEGLDFAKIIEEILRSEF